MSTSSCRSAKRATHIEHADIYRRGLELALEHVPMAAFVTSGQGAILFANFLGRTLLDREPELAKQLGRRNGPDPRVFDVTALSSASICLALYRTVPDRRSQLAARAHNWRLTRRELEVADWIIQGAGNRTIADELGCAEHTVELHVSRILAKAGVETRAQLIVAILGS